MNETGGQFDSTSLHQDEVTVNVNDQDPTNSRNTEIEQAGPPVNRGNFCLMLYCTTLLLGTDIYTTILTFEFKKGLWRSLLPVCLPPYCKIFGSLCNSATLRQ